MRTRILTLVAGVVALTFVTARPACAQAPGQDNVSGDLAVGYSVLRDMKAPRTFPAGLVLAVAADLNKKVRFVGEFSGNYKTVTVATATNVSLQILTYQGGIRCASGRKAKLRPFVQVLAGGAHATQILLGSGTVGSQNGFALQPGGGVDFRLNDHFDGRIQVDYRAIRSGGSTSSEYRVGFSIVFPFGR